MRDDTLDKTNPTVDVDVLRKLLHDVSNSIHSLGLSADLARLQLESNNTTAAADALVGVVGERDNCNELIARIREIINDM